MAYSTTHLYPEDLYGTNPLNLVTNELHTLQVPGPLDFYFIIPQAAPFFVDSLKVINAATGLPYVEGDDYQVGHLFVEAMDSTGRPIAGSIRFMKDTIQGQVRLTYRTLGGPWGFSDQAILRELSNKQVNPLTRSWGDIDTLPYSFPVLPHDQRVDTLIGSKEINATLEKIAEIIEASAAGASQSHITDYQNPHRVTKQQVLLGNVPNFAMATDEEMEDPVRNDLFTNPRGVLLLVNKFAVTPLNNHIAATGNVHDMVPADIGLGNVPNWAPATPAQAIDPTNNSAFMSPYSTALLIQKLQNDPRLDQLIIQFNEHITAVNPHGITPQMIGTFSAAEIDQKINAISQGGNATTFDNQTAEEWEAKFPSVDDINTIIEEITDEVQLGLVNISALNVDDPITEDDKNQRNAQKVAWTFGGYNVYGLYNALGDLQIVAATSIDEFPKDAIANGVGLWSSAPNAGYFIQPDGSIDAWGTGKVTIPIGYAKGPQFQTANACKAVWTSKDFVYLHKRTGDLMVVQRGVGNATLVQANVDIGNFYLNNGLVDNRQYAAMEIGTDGGNWTAVGDASWTTAVNAIKATATSGGYVIDDLRIGTDYFVVLTSKGGENYLWIYKINHGATITLTDVTATTDIYNHSTHQSAKANTVLGITQVAGSYGHFVLTKPIVPGEPLCLLYSFGDNSEGQLEITAASAPFYSVGAGYGYTVTINQYHFAEFWGNSPDNSMIYDGGAYITPSTP